jgi:MFS family permease
MKAFWRWTFVGLAVLTLLVAIGLGLALFVGLPEVATAIVIDDERFDLLRLRDEHWALIGLAAVIGAVVITTMIALAVVLGLGAAFFGLLVGTAGIALVLAPVALVVWWLWKEPKDKPTMPAS